MFARPGLPSFEYARPSDEDEVVDLLHDHGDQARLLMGGTDLLPALREGKVRPSLLIDVKALPGMREVAYDHDLGLRVGAAVTMNQLAHHPETAAHYPLLAQAAGTVASFQIRNRATLGGNLCNASPCADTSPACLVLEADLILYSAEGERVVPTDQFFLAPGKTALRPGEFMTAIRFPPPISRASSCYLKLGRCKSGDLSLVGAAVYGFQDPSSARVRFRIGLGSVAPTPLRVRGAEELLASLGPGGTSFAEAARCAMEASSPITDVRGTADYQRAMVRTLTLRALNDAWALLQEEC